MKFIVCENYDEMSTKAAEMYKNLINSKPDCVLGLATGDTPKGTYKKLVEYYNAGEIDFSGITTFNLDEYYPMKKDNPQSYNWFMNENLFSLVNFKKENINIPDGSTDNPEEFCENYDKKIESYGIDLMLLGIGKNGHIGFNEPDDQLITGTHVTQLTESTIDANSRFFSADEQIPTSAISMGMVSIIKNSRSILLIANGKGKHDAIESLKDNKINPQIPATLLKVHPDVTIICDKEAYFG